jgi:hypothetical protein
MTLEARRPAQDRPSHDQQAAPNSDTASISAAEIWWRQANAALRTLIDSGAEFTADDVTAQVGHPRSGRTMSALFSCASRRKQIVATGAVISRSGVVRVWRGGAV